MTNQFYFGKSDLPFIRHIIPIKIIIHVRCPKFGDPTDQPTWVLLV